jgi:hypothetical protein
LPEALSSSFSEPWREAANKEFKNFGDRGTWRLTLKPADRKAINKYVYTVKVKADNTIDKFKARLVVKCFLQRPGIDFDETFCPVAHS